MKTRIDNLRERIIDLTLTKPQSTESYATLIHLNCVSQLASFFAMNYSLDLELAAAAGLLHDIDVLVNGYNADHASHSSIMARGMLVSLGAFSEMISIRSFLLSQGIRISQKSMIYTMRY